MKSIGIFPNPLKDKGLKITGHIVKYIIRMGGRAFLNQEAASEIKQEQCSASEDELFSKSDIIIALGGDGTFLSAARKACSSNIPVLGVNLGTLGFLTEVDRTEVEYAVDRIFDGKYSIEDRMILKAVIKSADKSSEEYKAINDVVISRGSLSRIVNLKIHVNDSYVDSFPGDGLIIATPTGSTAYSLSAGGPIIEPGMSLMLLNPICPHTLHSRPFVVPDKRTIKITVDDGDNFDAMVTIDGQQGYKIRGGDVIEVSKAKEVVHLIRIYKRSFYSVLRKKIYLKEEAKLGEI